MNPRALVAALQTKDFASRKAILEELRNEFDVTNADNQNGSVVEHHNGFNGNNHNGGNRNNGDIMRDEDDPSCCYPVLLRLAYECPFKDVRFACEDVLKRLENRGVRIPRRKNIGPTRFIPPKECIGIDSDDEEIQSLFVDAFLINGRVSHINQLLAYHPRYLSCFLKSESHLMTSNGALPRDWRYYIGIMAASKHCCMYLVDECREMFLLMQGNPAWLEGIDYVPLKLRKLDALNRLLAHQPWQSTEQSIKELLVGGPPSETWTVSELTHAVVIMGHYLTLSGLVLSTGTNPEIDTPHGHSTRSASTSSSGSEPLTPTKLRNSVIIEPSPSLENAGTTAAVCERIKRVQQAELEAEEDEEDEVKLRHFQELESKECEEDETPGHTCGDSDVTTQGHGPATTSHYCNRFNVDNEKFQYEEYIKMKPKNSEVFREQDFNWQEHCFPFLNRSFPNVAHMLDEKFNCSYELTYRNVGDITNIDTTKFRLATWNYIHLLYGIYHDDYLYEEVNTLLEKSYKSYIKKVACYPERILSADFEFTDFLPSEKIHINMLVLEARFQAIILYATRSIVSYMNRCNNGS